MRVRSFLLIILLLGSVVPAKAQSFEVGDNVLGVSVGIGGYYRAYSSYSSQTPALGLSYELGVTELGPGILGVGGFLGYKSLSYRSRANPWLGGPGFEYDYRWSYLIIGLRGAWHYNDWHGLPELDTYAGLMLSYNSVTYRDNTLYPAGFNATYSYGGGGIGLTAFLGARYYFTPSVAAQLELGYGVSLLSLGVAFKF